MNNIQKLIQESVTREWADTWLEFYRDPWFSEKLDISARSALRKSQLNSSWKNDVKQEALLEFARQLRNDKSLGFDPERGAIEPFLSTIIYRCCQKSVRRIYSPQKNFKQSSLDYLVDEPSFDPCSHFDNSMDLHECIDQLDEPVRSIVNQLVDGKSIPEIAKNANRSSRTIYRRVEKATKQLREILNH